MPTTQEYNDISEAFRAKIANLPTAVRANFEKSLLELTSVAALRNVQLWTRYGSQQRNFISQNTPARERFWRLNIAVLVLREDFIPTTPVKTVNFPKDKEDSNGAKLNDYLSGAFTSAFGSRIIFNGGDGSFDYEYFSDSDTEDDDPSSEYSLEELWAEITGGGA